MYNETGGAGNESGYYSQNTGYPTPNKTNKSKKKIVTLVVILLVVVVGVLLLSPLIQRAKLVGTYYEYSLNFNGDERFHGEDRYLEFKLNGTCIQDGFMGKYSVKSGKVYIHMSFLGASEVSVGELKGDVFELKQTPLFGEPTTIYFKKADKYPGN